MDTNKVNLTIEKLPKSLVKLTITATENDMSKSLDRAYTKLSKNVTVKGFRKGNAPKSFVLQELGTKLFDEGINEMIWDLTEQAFKQEELNPISQPTFDVAEESNEKGKPFVFIVQFAVFPSLVMGDLNLIKIDGSEIQKAKLAREQEKVEDKIEEVESGTNEEKSSENETSLIPKSEDDAANDMSIKENEFDLDTYYSNLINEVFQISQIEIPEVLVEQELENHSHNFLHKLQDLQLDPEDYVRMQHTTFDEMKNKWREEIEFTYKQDLLLSQFAKDNDIEITEEEIQNSLAEIYPPETINKLDPNVIDFAAYSLKKQKSFLHLIFRIEELNEKQNAK